MKALSSAVAATFARQHGMISIDQLSELNVGDATRRTWLSRGIIVAFSRGIYRSATSPLSELAVAMGLSLARPDGFVTGRAAGRMLGVRRMGIGGAVRFSVSHSAALFSTEHAVVGRSSAFDAIDRGRRVDGIWVARPARLVFDLAAELAPTDLDSVVAELVHEGLVTWPQLETTAVRLARNARVGSGAFVRMLARGGGRPSESHPEVVLAAALHRRGVPVNAQSTELRLPSGRRVRLDLSVDALCWGVEVDAHPSHFDRRGAAADRARDRECAMIGWEVHRVTGDEMRANLNLVADQLLHLYQRRQRTFIRAV